MCPPPQSATPSPLGNPLSDARYTSFTYKGVVYRLGNNVFLPPDTYTFRVKGSKVTKKPSKSGVESDPSNETKFPELYRKSEYIKGSNTDVPKPFQIGERDQFHTDMPRILN